MLKKLKLAMARRKLKIALEHEQDMRASMEYTRRFVLPQLEEEIEALEIACEVDAFYKEAKF